MGAEPASVPVAFSIPPETPPPTRLRLSLQVHGVKYETQASVRVNDGRLIPISDSTEGALQGLPATHYGGVGGGFTTLTFLFNLPLDCVKSGQNTITFYFNGTDGTSSGYRVLGFNILGDGKQLIPADSFIWDDPKSWQPPRNNSADIAAGQKLWKSAPLIEPVARSIHAHCADCHAQDGRDLKYFNFSNNSIIVRSQFHGLTAQQGEQIASYIRSLNQPNPGRPWNPPYQPGPGLDSQLVQNWAAGAGLSAVLNNDSDMQPYLMPGGSTAGWAATAYLNARELPLAFQLPDWNSWLPKTHPMDAFGATFTDSACAADYVRLAGELKPGSASAYQNSLSDFGKAMVDCQQTLIGPVEDKTSTWTAALSQQIYSVTQWEMVKLWEINQQNGLEGMTRVAFGAKANPRAWVSGQPFNTSPFMEHIPPGPGIGNGSKESFNYLSEAWYLLQLILNDGQGQQTDHNPIDHVYAQGRVNDLSNSANNAPEAMLMLEWLIKALQEETLNGKGPDVQMQNGGFMPGAVTPFYLMNPTSQYLIWRGVSPATEASCITAYTQAWFSKIAAFTPSQFYTGGYADPNEDPQLDAYKNNLAAFGGQMWFILPRMRYLGVDPNLLNQITSWAATIWPRGNWSLNKAAACANVGHCSSDGPPR